MRKRSVNIAGHHTSVTLEDEFWAEVKSIADKRGLSLNKLITEIDIARGNAERTDNLSSAIRIFVLQQLKTAP